MKNTLSTVFAAALMLGAHICLPPAQAAPIWDDAIALYEFNNTLDDANGNNDGTSWKRSTDSAVPAVYTNVGASSLAGWDGVALSLADTRYVNLYQGDSNAFQITGDLTLFARVYITTGTSQIGIISKDGASGQRSYSMWLESVDGSSGKIVGRVNGNRSVEYTSADLSTGKWMDLAFVYDASSSITVYVNGISVSQNTTSIPASLVNATNTPLLLGAIPQGSPIGTAGMTGNMERAAIWNKALTSSEVLSLTVVPEPSTVVLSMTAFGMAVLLSRRRTK